MLKLSFCCLVLAAAALVTGCASQPVMLTSDGLYVEEPLSVPRSKKPKVPEGRISLEEAVALALANSPQVRMADISVRMGADGVLGALSNYLPKIQLQSYYHHVDCVAKSEIKFSGMTFTTKFGRRDMTNVTASMIVPVYTFGKNEAAYRQALRSKEAAQFDAVRVRQNVIAAASEGYIRVLEAMEFRRVTRKSVEQIKAHLSVAQEFFKQGMVTKNDVLAAKVRLLKMEHEYLMAQGNILIATANLNRIIGLPISNPTGLADHFSPVDCSLTEEQCLEAAMSFRPELGSMDRQRKAALAGLSAAKAARLPTISLSGGWNWTSDLSQKNKDNWNVDLIGEWTLFGGFGITAGIRQARHAIEQLKEGLRELVDGIALEVKVAHLNLLQSRKRIDVAREAVGQAQENLRIFREQYSQGLVTSTDVLDAEAQLARARADLTRALYENNAAVVNLENAMARTVVEVSEMQQPGAGEPADTRQQGEEAPHEEDK